MKELQNLQASAKLLLELCLDSVEHQRHLRLLTKLKVYSELQTKLWLFHLYSMSVLVLSESLLEQQNLLLSIQKKDGYSSRSLEQELQRLHLLLNLVLVLYSESVVYPNPSLHRQNHLLT